MVKFSARIFISCLLFASFLSLCAFDFGSNKYENKQAPEFSLQDLSGKDVSLKDFQDKAVILFFWTTSCPHCRRQIWLLNEEYENMKSSGIELLAININEPQSRVKKFIDSYSITYPVLLDYDGSVAYEYGIMVIPTLVFISKDRKIKSVSNSFSDKYQQILSD
ncbi:MAG: redoxin domain-containing protein [Candidatus Omnitrophica bacterium]|nr:redoxin domain-containing protein [Candidatus Omnitrophota bacterium]